MKFIATLFFCCLAFGRVGAQSKAPNDCNNKIDKWNLVNGNTFYEEVFTDSSITDSANAVIILKGMLQTFAKEIVVSGNLITAEVKDIGLNDKLCGFTSMNTPGFVSFPVSFIVNIEFKNGKYKIKCTSFKSDVMMMGQRQVWNWNTELYNKKGCLKGLIPINTFEKLSCKLNKLFTIPPQPKSEW